LLCKRNDKIGGRIFEFGDVGILGLGDFEILGIGNWELGIGNWKKLSKVAVD
jgi:hypothetical protein